MKNNTRTIGFIVCVIALIFCLAYDWDTEAIMLFCYILWLDIVDRLEGL